MNEQIKRRWIKALRSGKYKQARGYYEHMDRYCCLGVLQCVATGKINQDWTFGSIKRAVWLNTDDALELARLNDSGATFEQIALCIENGL